MREHYILCVLSQINVARAKQSDYTLHRRGKEDITVPGYQTNEAPVECLIKLAHEDGDPITGVICLVTDECNLVVTTKDGESFTAKSHFREAIKRYYEREGFGGALNPARDEGFFIDIAYDGENPSSNLNEIIKTLDRKDVLIDIDTTGGPRDAAFLLTSVVQFIEAKYRSRYRTGLGRTVYSNVPARQGRTPCLAGTVTARLGNDYKPSISMRW